MSIRGSALRRLRLSTPSTETREYALTMIMMFQDELFFQLCHRLSTRCMPETRARDRRCSRLPAASIETVEDGSLHFFRLFSTDDASHALHATVPNIQSLPSLVPIRDRPYDVWLNHVLFFIFFGFCIFFYFFSFFSSSATDYLRGHARDACPRPTMFAFARHVNWDHGKRIPL